MKKHSGKFTHTGLLTAIFGVLVMGTAFAASGMAPTSTTGAFNEFYFSMLGFMNNFSLIFLMSGFAILGFGLYLKKGAD